jgi:hypothetical protein
MKHLKIYFAILFFSFLGSANAELMAQSNTCKYGESLVTLRSDNGQYELSVSSAGSIGNNSKKFTFKLVKVGGSTIWEHVTDNTSCTGNYVTIGKGRIMIPDGNFTPCVIFGGDNGQGTGTFLRLHNDGELALYGGSWRGDGDKVWSTGTCGGVLGGCGEVGSR